MSTFVKTVDNNFVNNITGTDTIIDMPDDMPVSSDCATSIYTPVPWHLIKPTAIFTPAGRNLVKISDYNINSAMPETALITTTTAPCYVIVRNPCVTPVQNSYNTHIQLRYADSSKKIFRGRAIRVVCGTTFCIYVDANVKIYMCTLNNATAPIPLNTSAERCIQLKVVYYTPEANGYAQN